MEEKDQIVPGGGNLGMKLFLVSLSILFLSSMIGYLVVRSRTPEWPPPGTPRLPSGLWISTLIILGSSVSMESAIRSIRRGGQGGLRVGMSVTTLLGILFLVSQTVNWIGFIGANRSIESSLYAFTFYMLTGLHAAHVFGGLIPLFVVTRRAFQGAYTDAHHPGVQYCRMYWHFLAVVWIVMFALVFLVV